VVGKSDDTSPEDRSQDTGNETLRESSAVNTELQKRLRELERELEDANRANRESLRIIAQVHQGRFESGSAGTAGDDAESSQDKYVYQPKPGFLPELRDKLPLSNYVLALAVPAILFLLFSTTIVVPSLDAIYGLGFVTFTVSWILSGFLIALRRRGFPWAACIFIGSLGALCFSVGEVAVNNFLFPGTDGFLVLDLDLDRFSEFLVELMHSDHLVLAPVYYLLYFMTGVLLGRAVQRRGLSMGSTLLSRLRSSYFPLRR
jgi:hypothetical protein